MQISAPELRRCETFRSSIVTADHERRHHPKAREAAFSKWREQHQADPCAVDGGGKTGCEADRRARAALGGIGGPAGHAARLGRIQEGSACADAALRYLIFLIGTFPEVAVMYPDPKRVRDNRITIRLDDYEHALVQAMANYQG